MLLRLGFWQKSMPKLGIAETGSLSGVISGVSPGSLEKNWVEEGIKNCISNQFCIPSLLKQFISSLQRPVVVTFWTQRKKVGRRWNVKVENFSLPFSTHSSSSLILSILFCLPAICLHYFLWFLPGICTVQNSKAKEKCGEPTKCICFCYKLSHLAFAYIKTLEIPFNFMHLPLTYLLTSPCPHTHAILPVDYGLFWANMKKM